MMGDEAGCEDVGWEVGPHGDSHSHGKAAAVAVVAALAGLVVAWKEEE